MKSDDWDEERMPKFISGRPFADRDVAARKLVEIANAAEAVQDGRMIYDTM